MNGSDCGMFACKYADCITKDRPINFTQVSQAFRRGLCDHPVSRLPDRCFSLHLLHLGALLHSVAHKPGWRLPVPHCRERKAMIGHILGHHTSHIVGKESRPIGELPSLLMHTAYPKSCKRQRTGTRASFLSYAVFGSSEVLEQATP